MVLRNLYHLEKFKRILIWLDKFKKIHKLEGYHFFQM